MLKYLIVNLFYKENISDDFHDFEIENFKKKCNKAKESAKANGIEMFFSESANDRVISDSFALVEHNFDLTSEEKEKLIAFLTDFFNDCDFSPKGFTKFNTLKAVRFLKVNGELTLIN